MLIQFRRPWFHSIWVCAKWIWLVVCYPFWSKAETWTVSITVEIALTRNLSFKTHHCLLSNRKLCWSSKSTCILTMLHEMVRSLCGDKVSVMNFETPILIRPCTVKPFWNKCPASYISASSSWKAYQYHLVNRVKLIFMRITFAYLQLFLWGSLNGTRVR